MAEHGKSWPNLMSMSLQNELRQPLLNLTFFDTSYNWERRYQFTQLGAAAVVAANPALLIFLSGIDSDTKLDAVVQGRPLTPGTALFDAAGFGAAAADRLVLELHTYDAPASCSAMEARLYASGFQALDGTARTTLPLMMTEFGFAQDERGWGDVYARCLAKYLPRQNAGWMIWVLVGSYMSGRRCRTMMRAGGC
ncbi:glycoside hydrolase superfamily [Lasiosphaeria hispida]|uniref:Glycoside hydrolase superfamily n=1 Tax=Lasiosphaeria hispida TaxID=260671 RepID=A0AAJ0M964_9PEZI|nr:glycoside hydrolase superfamily [Lasiosphaeria hispida]